MKRRAQENPFIFGEIITESGFVDRTEELGQLVTGRQRRTESLPAFTRRFGKSSLVAVAFRRLEQDGIRTVIIIPVSSYASYTQFFERGLRAAGRWEKMKDWIARFVRRVKP